MDADAKGGVINIGATPSWPMHLQDRTSRTYFEIITWRCADVGRIKANSIYFDSQARLRAVKPEEDDL